MLRRQRQQRLVAAAAVAAAMKQLRCRELRCAVAGLHPAAAAVREVAA